MNQPIIVAHHIAALLFVFVALFSPACGVIFVLGVSELELGSICYGLWMIDETMRDLPMWFPWWPRGGRFSMEMLYRGGMTASNLIALPILLTIFHRFWSIGQCPLAIVQGTGGAVFLLARQREVFVGSKPLSAVQRHVTKHS